MKFFQKIICFFAGHKEWRTEFNDGPFKVTRPALVIAHQDYQGEWRAAIEVCPRCHTLWARILTPKAFDVSQLPKKGLNLGEDCETPKLPPTIECEFLDELRDETFKVLVTQNISFINNYIEIKTKDGKVSAWELDMPGLLNVTGEENIHLQISGLLCKVQEPVSITVSQAVFNVLDFPLNTVIAKGSRGHGQASTQGINAQGTLSQQKPVSTSVPGPGSMRKL